VTLAGMRHAERVSASILLHLGLDALVAATETAYVELAVALATDPDRRTRMAAAMGASYALAAVGEPARYTRDLEAVLDAAIAAGPR